MIQKTIVFIAVMILGFTGYAQDGSGWLWAKEGGGIYSFANSILDYNKERIVDLAVDSNDNYYFLAEVGSYTITYDGTSYDTYNDSGTDRDLFVFSTDSDGNFRWKKMIGGGKNDNAASLVLDAANNVYVSGNTLNYALGTPPILTPTA